MENDWLLFSYIQIRKHITYKEEDGSIAGRIPRSSSRISLVEMGDFGVGDSHRSSRVAQAVTVMRL